MIFENVSMITVQMIQIVWINVHVATDEQMFWTSVSLK